MRWIKDAKYVNEYVLELRFENDESKLVDLKDHLEGNIYKPLKDVAYFKRVTLNKDIDTVTWPNDADFAPEFLYDIGEPLK